MKEAEERGEIFEEPPKDEEESEEEQLLTMDESMTQQNNEEGAGEKPEPKNDELDQANQHKA